MGNLNHIWMRKLFILELSDFKHILVITNRTFKTTKSFKYTWNHIISSYKDYGVTHGCFEWKQKTPI